jgi:hypothetical protein
MLVRLPPTREVGDRPGEFAAVLEDVAANGLPSVEDCTPREELPVTALRTVVAVAYIEVQHDHAAQVLARACSSALSRPAGGKKGKAEQGQRDEGGATPPDCYGDAGAVHPVQDAEHGPSEDGEQQCDHDG